MKKPTEMTSARDKASFGEATTYHVRIARLKLLLSVGLSKYHIQTMLGEAMQCIKYIIE